LKVRGNKNRDILQYGRICQVNETPAKIAGEQVLKNTVADTKLKIFEKTGMNELQMEITVGFIGLFGVLIGTILTYFVDKLRINYKENEIREDI
jgi:hypothetical protein